MKTTKTKSVRKPHGIIPSNFEEVYTKACTDPNFTHLQAQRKLKLSTGTYYRYAKLLKQSKQAQKVKRVKKAKQVKKLNIFQKIAKFLKETLSIS